MDKVMISEFSGYGYDQWKGLGLGVRAIFSNSD